MNGTTTIRLAVSSTPPRTISFKRALPSTGDGNTANIARTSESSAESRVKLCASQASQYNNTSDIKRVKVSNENAWKPVLAQPNLIWRDSDETELNPDYSSYISGLYFIPKCHLTLKQYTQMKDDLTVRPRFPDAATDLAPEMTKEAILYEDRGEYVAVPCMYGIRSFGPIQNQQGEIAQYSRDQEPPQHLRFRGTLRDDFQRNAVSAILADAFNHRRLGIVGLPCGYGKTAVAIYASSALSRRTAYLVPTNVINEQMVDELHEWQPGARVGVWCDGTKQTGPEYDAVVITLQSCLCLLKSNREELQTIMKTFDMCVIDEVHHMGASVFSKLFHVIKSGTILGISATHRRRDGLDCLFEYYVGPVLYEVKREKTPWFHVIFMLYFDGAQVEHRYTEGLLQGRRNCSEMENDLVKDHKRNHLVLAQLILSASARVNPIIKQRSAFTSLPTSAMEVIGSFLSAKDLRKSVCWVNWELCTRLNRRHIIVFVNRRRHAFVLKEMLDSVRPDISSGLILGKMTKTVRDTAKSCRVIFATVQCVSEAFNDVHLDTGIIACAKGETEQLRGRLQRKAEFKFPPRLYDFVDMFSIFLDRARWRQQQYEEEAGFTCKYKILPSCE